MDRHVMIGFREVFPDEDMPSAENLIKDVPKEIAIRIAQKFIIERPLNGFDFCDKYISNDNLDLKARILQRVTNHGEGFNHSEFKVTNVITSLHFYELASKVCKAENDRELNALDELNIIKAYLIINQESIDAQDAVKIDDDANSPIAYKLMLTAMLPYHAIINVSLIDEICAQTIKAIKLFTFLEDKYPTLLSTFLNERRLSTWEDYIIGIFKLVLPILQALNDHKTAIIEFIDEQAFNDSITFLNTLSHQEIETEVDFKSLRAKPFYIDYDKRIIQAIIPLFAIDLLYRSLYFQLSATNSRIKEVKEFKSVFGKDFTEEILFNDLMRRIWGEKFLQRDEKSMSGGANKKKKDGNPDYYVRNGNKVYLIELKDALIKADATTSLDYSQIESELSEKLLRKEDGTPKAIGQIALDVKRVLRNENDWDKNCKGEKARVFPILMITDRILKCPGLNFLVNVWFKTEISKLLTTEEISRVYPITVVSIDSVMIHNEFISKNIGKLNQILKNYTSRFNINKYLRSSRSLADASKKYVDECMLPFDSYLQKLDDMTNIQKWSIFKPALSQLFEGNDMDSLADL